MMVTGLMATALALLVLLVILQLIILFRKTAIDPGPLLHAFLSVETMLERVDRAVHAEMVNNREETANSLRQSREEAAGHAKALREEVAATLKALGDTLAAAMRDSSGAQKGQLDLFSSQLGNFAETSVIHATAVKDTLDQGLKGLQEEHGRRMASMQQEAAVATAKVREEVTMALTTFNQSVADRVTDLATGQKVQLASMEDQLLKLTVTLDGRLKGIQEDTARQLDQMRATVDEKLQGTLEKRLGDSFKQVSERLEQVYKGLGEMQVLAVGVGDLKRVLTNVKTRGTWGEVQLRSMLDQILTIEQYGVNVATKDGGERVEFAIKLPGRGEDRDELVWLPIDAKFPVEDYQRLAEAQEQGDPEAAEAAGRQLESRIRQCAKDISDKYLNPPRTTDFAILYLPMEGLFAEVIRRPGLAEQLQRDCRVVIAGPTTLWSILNSLQMGFRTLTIQKRSSEVWNLLAAVKTEWSTYGKVLDKIQKKLQEATNTVDTAAVRTRAIGRKLKDVQMLPALEAGAVLMLDPNPETLDDASVVVAELGDE
jgi:DNA recombination protein RmuC